MELEQFTKGQTTSAEPINQGIMCYARGLPYYESRGSTSLLQNLEARLVDMVESITPSWLTTLQWIWAGSEDRRAHIYHVSGLQWHGELRPKLSETMLAEDAP